MSARIIPMGIVLLALDALGCSDSTEDATGLVGASSGGQTLTGIGGSTVSVVGGSSGQSGNVATGASTSIGGNAMGGSGSTGTSNIGGSVSTGGIAAGGVSPTGGMSGGNRGSTGGTNAGGRSSTGGTNAGGRGSTVAGASGSGGVTTGGRSAGGNLATGGNLAAGGTSAAGGTLAAGGTSATGGSSAMGGSGGLFATPPRIMIVGDSIAAGPGCYKKYLLKNLTDNGYSQFSFVGQYSDDCGSTVRHSAVSCSSTANYIKPTFTMSNCSVGTVFPGMSTLVTTHNPDLVLLQLGVNDVWGGTPTSTILSNYATLVQQARAHKSNVVVVVAQIHKIQPNCTDTAVYARAQELINAVPAWAKSISTDTSPVLTADLWTNSDYHESVGDCVHPNDAGAQRMGLNWYNALKGILTHR